MPILRKLAKEQLAAQALSVASESVFSIARHVDSKNERKTLYYQNLANTVFIKAKFE